MKKMVFFALAIIFAGLTAVAQNNLSHTNTTYQILDKNYLNRFNDLVVNKTIKPAEIKIIEDAWLKRFTNEWLIATLSFDKDCKADFLNGIIIPTTLQMPRLQKNYEAALKKSGRTSAIELYNQFHGRPTIVQFRKYMDTPEKVLKYMNGELYYDINMMCSILFDHMFKLKHDQLISNGYPIWKKSVNGKMEYSDGAEALLKFSEELVATFNEPYMFGLNAKLAEVGIKAKFNNSNLWTGAEAKDFAHKILFREVSPNSCDIWQLRVCLGCNAINELNDRLINGDANLRKRSGGDAMKVRAGK